MFNQQKFDMVKLSKFEVNLFLFYYEFVNIVKIFITVL